MRSFGRRHTRCRAQCVIIKGNVTFQLFLRPVDTYCTIKLSARVLHSSHETRFNVEGTSTRKGATWLITFGGWGTKSTKGIRNFNLQRSQVRKMGKIRWNQLLIDIYPFPPLSPQMHTLTKLFLGRKNIGGGDSSPTLPPPKLIQLVSSLQKCENLLKFGGTPVMGQLWFYNFGLCGPFYM